MVCEEENRVDTPWSSRVEKLDKHWREQGCIKYRRVLRDRITQLLPPEENMLDVGCGSAILYSHLPTNLKKSYMGVDFTPEFIDSCKKAHPEAKWGIEDARNLSFPDESFYLVNSTTLLQHILEWKQAAHELIRVSKRYVVTTCRIHQDETQVISTIPVLRRRFNPQDIISLYSQYGEVSHELAEGIFDNRPIIGIFVLDKQREKQ